MLDKHAGMSQVYSIRLAHPKTQLPRDSELRHAWFVCKPWAEDIMSTHMTLGDMASRIKCPEEWDEDTSCYMTLIDLEDMTDMCLDGFNMVDLWIDRTLEDFTFGWPSWYAYVSRSAAEGWTLTLMLDGQGKKTEDDAKDVSWKLWAMYTDYFDSKISSYTPRGQTLYKAHDFVQLRDKLLFVSAEKERGDFGRLVDNRMAAMPRMGQVYRTDRHGGDCLLWCATDDNCEKERQSSTARLWYP